MKWKKIFAIVRREYLERVRTKAFWIGTAVIPALFLAYIGISFASASKAGGERKLAVVDVRGDLYEPLAADVAAREAEEKKKAQGPYPHWALERRPVTGTLAETRDALNREIREEKIHAYVILDPAELGAGTADYVSTTVSEFIAMGVLQRSINRTVLRQKIAARGFPADLADDLEALGDGAVHRLEARSLHDLRLVGCIMELNRSTLGSMIELTGPS